MAFQKQSRDFTSFVADRMRGSQGFLSMTSISHANARPAQIGT
jgi:hypothetical protein